MIPNLRAPARSVANPFRSQDSKLYRARPAVCAVKKTLSKDLKLRRNQFIASSVGPGWFGVFARRFSPPNTFSVAQTSRDVVSSLLAHGSRLTLLFSPNQSLQCIWCQACGIDPFVPIRLHHCRPTLRFTIPIASSKFPLSGLVQPVLSPMPLLQSCRYSVARGH